MFSAAHSAGLSLLVVIVVMVVVFRRGLREPSRNQITRWTLAAVLLCSEAALQLSYITENSWGIYSLPLQLCSLMLLVGAVVLMTKHKALYDVLFFLGSMGALQALLTPNLDETFPHFRYFQFFIAHIGIIGAALFVVAVERYRPTFRSVLRAMLWLHILAIPAWITNYLSGTTNFMFLARKPATASLLDWLAPWPWYLLELEIIAFCLFFALYGVVKGLDLWMSKGKSGRYITMNGALRHERDDE
ncbi:TIGR02206 family membrane protein [Paenibacillus sinopodophylli]|uniref:YwaF family protein n=1 Tax=Paenibacillus sinopodophylli TaxID=1837342 RepID=UPI00110CA7E0|nr:TIGR02206 family membrane protein [Paenibacillus sinopodophylli]